MQKSFLAFLVAVIIFSAGCIHHMTPMYTSYQGAQIHVGKPRLTTSCSNIFYMATEQSGIESINIGCQYDQGFSLGSWLTYAPRVRFEFIAPVHNTFDSLSFLVLSADFKVSIIKNRLAFSLGWFGYQLRLTPEQGGIVPRGMHQWDPAILLLSIPVNRSLDLNFTGRFIVLLLDPPFRYLSYGAGAGITLGKIIVRPEISALNNLDGDWHRLAFGIGATFLH